MIKKISAVTSIVLACVLVGNVVQDTIITAEAKETLFGIQTLVQDVEGRQTPYKILEIVPDVTCAEIGYFVNGNEPALSARILQQDNTYRWEDWLTGLGHCKNSQERVTYITELADNLQAFYQARGISLTNTAEQPVSYTEYKEVAAPEEGYTEHTFNDEKVKGYFEYVTADNVAGEQRYHLTFDRQIGLSTSSYENADSLLNYYLVQEARRLTVAEVMALSGDEELFILENPGVADAKFVFSKSAADAQEELKEIVSGGDVSGGDVSGGNVSGGNVSDGDGTVTGGDDSVTTGDAGTNNITDNTPESTPEDALIDLAATVSGGETEDTAKDTSVTGGDTIVSSGDGIVTGGDAGSFEILDGETVPLLDDADLTDYYIVKFRVWNGKDDVPLQDSPEFKGLYKVLESEIILDDAGNYIFTEDEGRAETAFPGQTIYYKGGFQNNEWFRESVIDLEVPSELEKFPIEVITMTAEELSNLEKLPEYDLLYLSSGWQTIAATSEPRHHYSLDKGDLQYDLSADMAAELYNRTVEQQLPCIVDARILYGYQPVTVDGKMQFDFGQYSAANALLDDQLESTNIFRLAMMLSQAKLPTAYDATIAIADLIQTMFQDDDKDFVNEHIYSFLSVELVSADFRTKQIYNIDGLPVNEKFAEGFEPVEDVIKEENLNREADAGGSYAQLPLAVTRATVVRHIINFQNRQDVTLKSSITVLELEGSMAGPNTYDLTEDEVRTWVLGEKPNRELTINIDHMTTSEFIGHIDDINEKYDMVYIGSSRGNLNVAPGTADTVFNDTGMNGLIYFHTGDFRVVSAKLAGQLQTEYLNYKPGSELYSFNPVRYSGNDITAEKRDALLSFVNAHYPIVVSDELVKWVDTGTTAGGETISERIVEDKLVDNSSYMYEFLELVKGKSNFYTKNDIAANIASFQFNMNRPKIRLQNWEVKHDSKDDQNNVYEINLDDKGKYLLEYRFKIVNEGAASVNTRYKCQLFIDMNADGKYAAGEELKDIAITQNGKTVAANELYMNKEYVVRRYVPDGYKGLLPWKLLVTQLDAKQNPADIRSSEIGYTKLLSLEREPIKVLQITREPNVDSEGKVEQLFNLHNEFSEYNNSPYHILLYGGTITEGGIPTTYPGIYNNFDISVETKTVSQYTQALEENPELLDNYNMLILGFSQGYKDISGKPLEAIKNYISSGKSVLMASDTMTATNYKLNDKGEAAVIDRETGKKTILKPSYPTYNLTHTLREMIGMDRYGVMLSGRLTNGAGATVGTDGWDEILKLKKDMPFIPHSNKGEMFGMTQGYTYAAINGGDDDVSTFTGKQLGVLADTVKNTYTNLNFGDVYFTDKKVNNAQVVDNGEMKGEFANGVVTNLYVEQVNRGQITEYPYMLSTKFEVSPTHAQPYTLDFYADNDKDGQSDLVVWYCMGERAGANGAQPTIYSASPKDVMNNYFIYSKGNVTYTCMGYSGTSTVDEAKLFINTMIAAYTAGLKDPEIAVLSDNTASAVEISTAHRYYDEANNFGFEEAGIAGGTENYEKVYFTVNDLNFVKGTRKIAVKCYYEDTNGETVEGIDVKVKPLPSDIYLASSGAKLEDAGNLSSGTVYYVLVSKQQLTDAGGRFSVFFESETTITMPNEYGEGEKTLKTGKTYKRFDFTKVQLFNLE